METSSEPTGNLATLEGPEAVIERALNSNVKTYPRRWVMLLLFVLVSMMNEFHWIQFSIITNVLTAYYNVDSQTVNWTSMVYMIVYIPLIFPGSWLLRKKGLKLTVMLGAFGTAVGSWIKVLAVSRDRFYVLMIGQTAAAIAQVFILGIPAEVAAVWFGPDQVSSACAIGVFGNQLGVAIGFLLPPVIVKLHEDLNETGKELSLMFYVTAAICTAIFLLIVIFFQDQPPKPPSEARSAAANEHTSFSSSMKNLLKNKNYILLLVSYGMNTGVFYAISTLLNQVVLGYFPGEEENAGRIGLTMVLCGMLGSIIGGVILDKTHKFKETTVIIYLLSLISMVAYSFTFFTGYISVTFITGALLGFFMTGYLPVGFEFAAELTYPEPEGTTSGLLNASAQVFGILFTVLGGWIVTDYGGLASNITLAVGLFFGLVLTVFIKSHLRRQAALKA